MDVQDHDQQPFLAQLHQRSDFSRGLPPSIDYELDSLPLEPFADEAHDIELAHSAPTPPTSSSTRHGKQEPLGIPNSKIRISALGVAALTLALICSSLGILMSAHNGIAWHLTLSRQLIVAGFLLSIMNLCLTRSLPLFCVLIEARLGKSTLQNYDGLLRGQILETHLNHHWRAILLFYTALPICLSVAYKAFQDGSSFRAVNATEISGLPPYYGLYHLPGLNTDKYAIFLNATSPFMSAARLPIGTQKQDAHEPAPPQYPQSYGANLLSLSAHQTAMLDLPSNDRLYLLQRSLMVGELLYLEADVHGSIATWNETMATVDDPDFRASCDDEKWKLVTSIGSQRWSVQLLTFDSTGENSLVWLGLLPNEKINDCDNFAPYARRYDITRQSCHGTWTISNVGIQLSSGSCNESELPALQQYPYKVNTFFLGTSFIETVKSSLISFGNPRSNSSWKDPSMTTAVAAMTWSSLVTINGPGNFLDKTPDSPNERTGWGCCNLSLADSGMLYNSTERSVVRVPTLRRSPWLYLVFAIHPLLLAVMLFLSGLLYSVPLCKGFGMIAVLAGVDREDLDALQGASFSGKLQENIRLSIIPVDHDDAEGYVRYRILKKENTVPNQKLRPGKKYA